MRRPLRGRIGRRGCSTLLLVGKSMLRSHPPSARAPAVPARLGPEGPFPGGTGGADETDRKARVAALRRLSLRKRRERSPVLGRNHRQHPL